MHHSSSTITLVVLSILSILISSGTLSLVILSIWSIPAWKWPNAVTAATTALFHGVVLVTGMARGSLTGRRSTEPKMNMISSSSLEKGPSRTRPFSLAITLPSEEPIRTPVFLNKSIIWTVGIILVFWLANVAFAIHTGVSHNDDEFPTFTMILAGLCGTESIVLIIMTFLSVRGRSSFMQENGRFMKASKKKANNYKKYGDHWTVDAWAETPATAHVPQPSAGLFRNTTIGKLARKYTLRGNGAALKDNAIRSIKLSDNSAPMIGRSNTPEFPRVMAAPPPRRPAVALTKTSASEV